MSEQSSRPGSDRDPTPAEQDQYPYHRRFVRHKVRLKVEVHSTTSYQAWTHNLSEDGVCFEIPLEVANGREVVVWIFLGRTKDEPPIQARCRVVWHETGKRGFRHGGQFLFFLGDGAQRLRDWIESL